MIDIYNRLPTDGNYIKMLETESEMESILSQIKMILGTRRGDILGACDFGVDLKQYLFSMNFNKEELDNIIQESVLPYISYDAKKFNVGISVDFGHDTQNACDYAVLNVTINDIKKIGIMINQN